MYVQFVDSEGTRRTMRFGRLNKKEFAQVEFRVKRLIAFRLAGEPPDRETTSWLSEITPYVRKKLEAAGLISSSLSLTVGAHLAAYFAKGKKKWKKSTVQVYDRCRRRLITRLGELKPLRSVTPGDARDWRDWLFTIVKGENTVRKQVGVARQIFEDAVRHKVIEENPFDGLPASMVESQEKMVFVDAAASAAVLDACIDQDWRMIFAMCRWGGLRCPSEVLSAQWTHVNWARNRMTVLSPKTAHHKGKESRIIPLFPELRAELERGFELAEDRAKFIVTRYRSSITNMRTQFGRIIAKAGVDPWSKPFQNLRSTRETELADQFPIQVVTKWIGNSQVVARKNYLQVTEDHFARASGGSAAKALHVTATPAYPHLPSE